MICKVCGWKYHCCSSCDTSGEEWLRDSYCSKDCFLKSKEAKECRKKIKNFFKNCTKKQRELFDEIRQWPDYKQNLIYDD